MLARLVGIFYKTAGNRYVLCPVNFIISKAAGDIVLIPLTDSVVNMGGMLVLNETSVFILEHIKVATTITQLIDAFNKEYDCPDTQELTNDITSFLT